MRRQFSNIGEARAPADPPVYAYDLHSDNYSPSSGAQRFLDARGQPLFIRKFISLILLKFPISFLVIYTKTGCPSPGWMPLPHLNARGRRTVLTPFCTPLSPSLYLPLFISFCPPVCLHFFLDAHLSFYNIRSYSLKVTSPGLLLSKAMDFVCSLCRGLTGTPQINALLFFKPTGLIVDKYN